MLWIPMNDNTPEERAKRQKLLQYILSKCNALTFLFQSLEDVQSMKSEHPKWVAAEYEEEFKRDFETMRPFLSLCRRNGGYVHTVHNYQTMRFSYPMSVMTVELKPELKKELLKYDLLEWNGEKLPQDPCFYMNGKPRFLCSTHDDYHFGIEIENQEKGDRETLIALGIGYNRS